MKIIQSSHDSKQRVQIIHDDKILLTVAPWYGAKLTAMKLNAGQEFHDVLWPVSDADLESNAWFKQSILFPFPNRLKDGQYHFEDRSYQFPINEVEVNNQLHGMLFNAPFKVTDTRESDLEASITLAHEYSGILPYYPFPFVFEVTYRYYLSGFSVKFQVKNTGQERLPFGIGWHPYFQIDGIGVNDYVFSSGDLEEIALDQRTSIPTGERKLIPNPVLALNKHKQDNAYQLKGETTYSLKGPDALRVSFRASDSLSYLQLFTPDGGETIAIEPMTCNVNAFNNQEGLLTLEPGDSFDCEVKIELTKDTNMTP